MKAYTLLRSMGPSLFKENIRGPIHRQGRVNWIRRMNSLISDRKQAVKLLTDKDN